MPVAPGEEVALPVDADWPRVVVDGVAAEGFGAVAGEFAPKAVAPSTLFRDTDGAADGGLAGGATVIPLFEGVTPLDPGVDGDFVVELVVPLATIVARNVAGVPDNASGGVVPGVAGFA